MTSTTPQAPQAPTAATGSGAMSVSFARVVRSEWIKLRTLRSTVWSFGIIVLFTIGFGLLMATTIPVPFSSMLDSHAQNIFAVAAITLGIYFTQLVAATLGVLIISGEYTTGMIRSTFTAVPQRLPALVAKALILVVSMFVVGFVSLIATAILVTPIMEGKGVQVNLLDGEVLRPLLGGAGYLALIALLAFAFGSILRSSAGGIASALGLILVLPAVLTIMQGITRATWTFNVGAILPSAAGGHMFEIVDIGSLGAPSGVITLDATQGFLVLLTWVVVLLVGAALLTKRRDA